MNRKPNVSERTTTQRDRYGNQTTETVKYDTRNAPSDVWSSMTNWFGDTGVPQPQQPVPMPSPGMNTDLNDPTNRDSVIAALTPGEFVLNKEASQMYAPQVEAMNNHGLQQRHAENVAFMNGGQVPQMQGNVPPMQLNAGGRAERVSQINSRRAQDYIRKADWEAPMPYYESYPAPDLPHHEPARPTIKPSGRAGPPYYNEGGAVPPLPHFNEGGDVVIPGYFLGGLVDAAQQLFGGSATQVPTDPNAGYADYTQQQFLDEANNPSRNVAPSAGQYSPQQPTVPEIPSDRAALAGDYNDRIARQQGSSLNGVDSDPLPSIDLTPPPPGSDQAILQNSSQSTEKTEDNLLALQQGGIDANDPFANVPRETPNNQRAAAEAGRYRTPPPMEGQGVPPMHQMPDGTMMPGASHQGGQSPQRQTSVYDTVAQHEGFRDEAYDDGTGVWTIGFGRITNPDGSRVQKGQTTNREAEQQFLKTRVDQDKQFVLDYAKKHGYNWRPNQVDALTSFTYNLGKGGLDQLTAGGSRSDDEILNKLPEYSKAGGKQLQGLLNRRNDEAALFAGQSYGERYGNTAGADTSAIPTGFFDWNNNTFVDPAQTGLEEYAGSLNAVPQPQGVPAVDYSASGPYSGISTADLYNQYATLSTGPGWGSNPESESILSEIERREAGGEDYDVYQTSLQDPNAVVNGVGHQQRIQERRAAAAQALTTQEALLAADQAKLQVKLDNNTATDQDIRNFEGKKADLVAAQEAEAVIAETEAPIIEANAARDAENKAKRDAFAAADLASREVRGTYNPETGKYETPDVSLDYEGVVAAESAIAAAAGGTSMSDDEATATKDQVTTALQAAGNKGFADSMAGNGPPVSEDESRNALKDVETPKETNKVVGAFKSAFKGLFGSGDVGGMVAQALMLYAGARLTGMSGNAAIAFAGKAALQQGAQEKAQQAANKETADKIAYNQVDWSKVSQKQLDKFRKDGKYDGLPRKPDADVEARRAALQESAVKGVDWSQATKDQRDNYIQTGSVEGIPLLKAGAVALGKKTAEELYVPGHGKIDVRSGQDGKGAFVIDPFDGTVKTPDQFKVDNADRGATEWKKDLHDQATITKKFSGTAAQIADTANKKLNKFKGKDDPSTDVGIIPDVIGNEAWLAYQGYVDAPKSKWRSRTGELNGAINRALVDYGDAMSEYARNPDVFDKPASLEPFVERQLFKVETGLGYNNVENTDAKNVKSTMKLVENQLAGDGVLVSDKRFAGDYKSDWADLQSLWTMVDKSDDKAIWHDREGWNGKMFFFNALLDTNNPNHGEAMRTYTKVVKK